MARMNHRPFLAVAAAAALGLGMLRTVHARPLAPPGANPNERSQNGVLATDDAWSLAEMTGNTDLLDRMLAPDYRSVNPDGTVLSKARLIAGAAKRKGTSEEQARKAIADYAAAHPHDTKVSMHGDVAIVSYYQSASTPDQGLRSSDIFMYEQGAWHALYSQHSDAGK